MTVVYNIVWLTVVFRISGFRIGLLAAFAWAFISRAGVWAITLLALEAVGGSLGTQAYAVAASVYVASIVVSLSIRMWPF